MAIGDLNGDGLADIAWNSREDATLYPNWYSVAAGSRSALRESVTASTTGMPACATIGVAAITDWNGDGYSDLVATLTFGCDFLRPPELILLAVYHGSYSGIAVVPQWTIRLDDRFVHRLTYLSGVLGDVDGDGYGDVSVVNTYGGVGTSPIPPEQIILYGSSFGDVRSARIPPPVSNLSDWALSDLLSIGDINGDSAADIAARLAHDGGVFVYTHARDFSVPPARLVDPARAAGFSSFLSAGDADGDGLADLLASSELAATFVGGELVNRGRAYLFSGSADAFGADPVWTERSPVGSLVVMANLFGSSYTSPGDIDGDGIDDMTMADSLGNRLCVRRGRVDLSVGTPDLCLNDAISSESRSF